ncbi:MAG: RsmE family RNA methyltransferase, partial [Planctomycetes bacterium]|nr:RsmE family RNA methyltransferase [Planctomycetota bacterium]
GAGRAARLEVIEATRRSLSLRSTGEVVEEVPPGAPGSRLAQLEIGLSLPKPGRAEDMVDRLTQLGVARLQPLVFQRSPDHARKWTGARMEKLQRAGREAMKQCLRLWPVEIGSPLSPLEWLDPDRSTLVLDPRAPMELLPTLATLSAPRNLRLMIGPEGGFSPKELEALRGAGAIPVALRGHVLRIETAAELGAGLILQSVRSEG